MDHPQALPITHLSLCTGYGGIDLGLKRVLGNLRSIAYCEREAFAVANLLAKIEGGFLDPAPIWTDLKSFPWEDFRGSVDLLSGGYPCQPFSNAGQRRGKDDPRHLWPWILDGIRIIRPGYCFFENVDGHIERGLQTVIGDLEREGYQVEVGLFTAAEVGLPHQRKRIFILAKLADTDCIRPSNPSSQIESAEAGVDALRMSWASSPDRLDQLPARPQERQHQWEEPRTLEPFLGGNSDGTSSRLVIAFREDRLHLLGNGVVPQVAAVAFWHLLCKLHHLSPTP